MSVAVERGVGPPLAPPGFYCVPQGIPAFPCAPVVMAPREDGAAYELQKILGLVGMISIPRADRKNPFLPIFPRIRAQHAYAMFRNPRSQVKAALPMIRLSCVGFGFLWRERRELL